jgi:hypothetical protein
VILVFKYELTDSRIAPDLGERPGLHLPRAFLAESAKVGYLLECSRFFEASVKPIKKTSPGRIYNKLLDDLFVGKLGKDCPGIFAWVLLVNT